MTKKAQGYLNSYEFYRNYYGERTLWDAYRNPSVAKENAYRYCLNLKDEKNGYDGTVCGASCHFFSYAFKYMEDGIEHLMYITHANDYDFALS